jgi:signal transduction histidine kinase
MSEQPSFYTLILFSIPLLGVFILLFICVIYFYHKKNKNLLHQLITTEITAAEKERKRIAADLHDDFGQLLSVIRLQVSSINPVSQADRQLIKEAAKHIDDVLKRMRVMSEAIVPNQLLAAGFCWGIEELVATFNKLGSIQVHWELSGDLPESEPDHWLHHYRIIQEILNNALKHSNAKNIWINALVDDKYFLLSVTDDGIGFDKEAVARAATGSGLRNIFNRVALLRGQIIIDTLPQQGVRYQIKTPLNYAK